jgi:Uma2 family endonuclease
MPEVAQLPTTNEALLALGADKAPVRMSASESEYWALLERAAYRAEYHKGEIIATMGYENALHSELASELLFQLKAIFRNQAYRFGNSNRPVCIEACDNSIFIPDGSVLEVPLKRYEYQPGMDAELTPFILFEVLSPSTRVRDFGEKLPCYKQIPSLKHIFYLETEEVKVHHIQRQNTTQWLETIYTARSEKITLENGEIDLEQLYSVA